MHFCNEVKYIIDNKDMREEKWVISYHKDVRSPAKSIANVKPITSFREEVRIQHGTDVLTFETDSEGNVPVAKIDAVLSHVVALKYRLPQNKQSYSDHSTDGFGSRSPTPRPHSREGKTYRL